MLKMVFYALLFIASGGLLFGEVFRKNRPIVVITALVAIASFSLLLWEGASWWGLGKSPGGAEYVESAPPIGLDKPPPADRVVFASLAPGVKLDRIALGGTKADFRFLTANGRLYAWSISGLSEQPTPPLSLSKRLISGDGEVILDIDTYDGVALVHKPPRYKPERVTFSKPRGEGYLSANAVSHSGQYLALGFSRSSGIKVEANDAKNSHKQFKGRLVIVPLVSKERSCEEDTFHSTNITDLRFARNEKLIVSATWNGQSILMSTDCRHIATFYASEYLLRVAAISDDANRVFIGELSRLSAWRMPKDYEGTTIRSSSCDDIALDGFSVHLLCADEHGAATLYDAGEGRRMGHLTTAFRKIRHAAFDATGKVVALMSEDGSIALWDVGSRELIGQLRIFTETEWAFVGKESKYCASPNADRFLRIETVRKGLLWNSTDTRLLSDEEKTRLSTKCDAAWRKP